MSEDTPIIEVEGLTYGFDGTIILENVSFRIFKGEIFVILGESGSGKSTLIRQMIGLLKPRKGRIVIYGVNITTAGEEELGKVRRHMGVLFQGGALFGSMTLKENVALPLRRLADIPDEIVDLIVRMKLGMVNLAGYQNHLPSELSGGMKNRAALARAMALDPTVLFLDEPTSGLDPITAAEIDNLIKTINIGIGTTMVIITQDLASIFSIANRAIMLDKSRKGIIAEGDPRVLRDTSRDPHVVNFFNRKPIIGKGKGQV